jgi:hypothetical protein
LHLDFKNLTLRPSMGRIYLILSLLSLLLSSNLQAQTDSVNKATSAPPLLGFESGLSFIIPHSTAIASISSYYPLLFQLSYSKLHTSQKAWEACYCTPKTGLIGGFHHYRNRQLLGTGSSLMGFVEPYFGFHRKLFWGFRLATGPVYLSAVYDSISNPDNLFFSSRLSLLMQVGLSLGLRISQFSSVTIGVFYNHISNGGLKEPNKGMNYPAIQVGLQHMLYPAPEFLQYERRRSWKNEKPITWVLSLLYTSRATGDIYEKRLPVYGLDAAVHWRHGFLAEMRGGVEWVADEKRSAQAQKEGWSLSPHHAAVHVGEYLMAGKFSLGLAIGVYVWQRNPFIDPVYQRYQLGYRPFKFLQLSVSLRAHRSVADFADLRCSILF